MKFKQRNRVRLKRKGKKKKTLNMKDSRRWKLNKNIKVQVTYLLPQLHADGISFLQQNCMTQQVILKFNNHYKVQINMRCIQVMKHWW